MLQIKGDPDFGWSVFKYSIFSVQYFFVAKKTKEVLSRLVYIMWAHRTLELLAVHSYCPNGKELKRAANFKSRNNKKFMAASSMYSQWLTGIIPGKICLIGRYNRT
jgi:hypothetical protein